MSSEFVIKLVFVQSNHCFTDDLQIPTNLYEALQGTGGTQRKPLKARENPGYEGYLCAYIHFLLTIDPLAQRIKHD